MKNHWWVRQSRMLGMCDAATQWPLDVIGKWILFKFAGAPLDPADFGWYLGKVTMALTSREKKKNSECNFYIAFATKDDHKNDAVVRAFKEKTKVTIAAGVDAESRGASARWVLLAKSP